MWEYLASQFMPKNPKPVAVAQSAAIKPPLQNSTSNK
jgi:hypothetical protein